MREIKFRAWDKEEKRFWSEEEMNKIGGYYYTFGVSDNDGEFVLQQYTGLKDKNGKEIYEGDIVKSIYDSRRLNTFETDRYSYYENIMIVEHDDCNPCFVLVGINNKDKREYDFIQCGLRTNEIIGNIYENGDLIKDSTK